MTRPWKTDVEVQKDWISNEGAQLLQQTRTRTMVLETKANVAKVGRMATRTAAREHGHAGCYCYGWSVAVAVD